MTWMVWKSGRGTVRRPHEIGALLALMLILKRVRPDIQTSRHALRPGDPGAGDHRRQPGQHYLHLERAANRVKIVFSATPFLPGHLPADAGEHERRLRTVDGRTAADQTAFIFISFDPDRDTPERLDTYVGAFNEEFYGLYLADDEFAYVKKDYGVYAERVLDGSQSAADYLIDHTAFVYIIDKENNLHEIFPHDAPKGDIAADIAHLVGR